ncbi:HAD family hydrolase [Quadrisphaera sp. GCM10027208]|uniref:HAD family hydrolase n=1 Tax=Quadrisphaera sp. GCM10027208 TaxID=3273423 RepID=UPI0036244042
MTRATGPRAVLLDLDGTLLDHDGASRSALLAALEGSDLPHETDVDVPLARWRDLETQHFQRYLEGELTFQEQRVERTREFLASYGVRDRDQRALLEWFDRYRRLYEDAWRVFDDVHPFLQAAAALDNPPTLAVVTNGDLDQQASKLARVGLDGIALHTSSELGARKPDAAVFHRVCDVVRVQPADAWFVGDNREVDAEGSERAGLHGIWLDRGGGTTQRGHPSRADSLTDVIDWMRDEQ